MNQKNLKTWAIAAGAIVVAAIAADSFDLPEKFASTFPSQAAHANTAVAAGFGALAVTVALVAFKGK